ncbi:MAG: phosphoribosylformylglycinamidine cyclo-ligase [Desulfovermiculus sp.]|nr:phosphoribosylformylglycinamidine cyclo-ligase [Desulfovermiculus sp.]
MQDRGKAYKEAGVNLEAADTLVKRIKTLAASTHTKGVLSDIGLFGGMFKLDLSDTRRPVLVSSTDGVGTKLKLAFALDIHDSIGIDLVGMNVNDIVVHGAKPLFFLDYFAADQLDVDQAEQVIAGIAKGCQLAGCALLGGETAELPGFYKPGEYDLSGFSVGIVDDDKIVDGSSVGVGHAVIGLGSSGLHSNGYSLVRKVIAEQNIDLHQPMPGTDQIVGRVLLEPTRIYVKTILNVLRDFEIKGMAHITGGGLYDNLPRVLPRGVKTTIDFSSWSKPPVFEWLHDLSGLSWPEMLKTFNCGLGMVIIVEERVAEDVLLRLQGLKETAWKIGQTEAKREQDEEKVDVVF